MGAITSTAQLNSLEAERPQTGIVQETGHS